MRFAGPNPWGAPSLEWATSSPPPVYNFAHIPVVESSTPLWDSEGELPVVSGLRVDEKEILLTTASFVTTAGLISTQTVFVVAGKRLPVAIECSAVAIIRARLAGAAKLPLIARSATLSAPR